MTNRGEVGSGIGMSNYSRTVEDTPYRMRETAVSVGALVRSIRDLLEHRLRVVRVTGEISNLTMARSGHWYFVLKDPDAQIKCVMFRHRNALLDWRLTEGTRVEAVALVTLYEPRGDLQLNVESLQRAGRGSLFEEFIRLRDRLQAEGLFDPALKRALPTYPRRIGVVTSAQAAALQDVLQTLRRRDPGLSVTIYPATVQGERSAGELRDALARAGDRAECDVLLLVRGGGSIEDLWSFNDEALARAIRACPIPVVSGVGHETDFTIADFAADVRAPTPTAAAELVSPTRAAMAGELEALVVRLTRDARHRIEREMQHLDNLQRGLASPGRLLAASRNRLVELHGRLTRMRGLFPRSERNVLGGLVHRQMRTLPDVAPAWEKHLSVTNRLGAAMAASLRRRRDKIAHFSKAMQHLGPVAVLARGYSIARDEKGTVLRRASGVTAGAAVRVTLQEGELDTQVVAARSDAPGPGTV